MKYYTYIAAVLLSVAGVNATAAVPVTAYEGCTLTWTYPADKASLVQSFGVHVDDRTQSIPLDGSARSIPCADLGMTLGQEHLLKVRAWNKALGHSPFAEITVKYLPKPNMVAPSGIKIILEWEAPK